MSVKGGDTCLVLYCHAGCTPEEVIRPLGYTMRDLFYETTTIRETPKKGWVFEADPDSSKEQPSRLIAEYRYRDASDTLRYVVQRMEPKTFKQWRPTPDGGREWNLRGIDPLPYKLPECLHCDDQPLIVVEGEKDVETLWERGFVATCNSGGAGKWRKEFATYFAGRDVIIIPDNDAAGEKHAKQV
ncbi:MAG TPA: hypothetical protein VGJ82_18710, partial [Thermoanaerobaculia bacterium]